MPWLVAGAARLSIMFRLSRSRKLFFCKGKAADRRLGSGQLRRIYQIAEHITHGRSRVTRGDVISDCPKTTLAGPGTHDRRIRPRRLGRWDQDRRVQAADMAWALRACVQHVRTGPASRRFPKVEVCEGQVRAGTCPVPFRPNLRVPQYVTAAACSPARCARSNFEIRENR